VDVYRVIGNRATINGLLNVVTASLMKKLPIVLVIFSQDYREAAS
jgi:hypothetical protein